MNAIAPETPPALDNVDADRLIHADYPDALALFKRVLKQSKQDLFQRYQDGDPVAHLVREHSALVDLLVTCAWYRFMPTGEPAALIAVGGYGRR